MGRSSKRSGGSSVSPPPTSNSGDASASSTPSLSSLSAKPCQACGRQITPRAKWARNWSEIRFCSDRCRAERSIRLGGKGLLVRFERDAPEAGAREEERWRGMALERALHRVEEETKLEKDKDAEGVSPLASFRIDMDAWAEEALLRLGSGQARPPSIEEDGKGKNASSSGWAKVSDAERLIRDECREIWGAAFAWMEAEREHQSDEEGSEGEDGHEESDQPAGATSSGIDASTEALSKVIGPTLRERVRRAARRRIVLDPSLWAREAGDPIEVWGTPVPPSAGKGGKAKSGKGAPKGKAGKSKDGLPNGAKRLESLEDVSFARGEMYLRVRRGK